MLRTLIRSDYPSELYKFCDDHLVALNVGRVVFGKLEFDHGASKPDLFERVLKAFFYGAISFDVAVNEMIPELILDLVAPVVERVAERVIVVGVQPDVDTEQLRFGHPLPEKILPRSFGVSDPTLPVYFELLPDAFENNGALLRDAAVKSDLDVVAVDGQAGEIGGSNS